MSVENEENVVNMDDLVKRLREVESNHSGWGYAAIAADRIEQLVASCEELEANIKIEADFIDATINQLEAAEQRGYANAVEAERKLHEDRIEELEAKLLSATMDGYDMAKHEYRDRIEELEAKLAKAVETLEYYNVAGYEGKEARATLAELKGKNDEWKCPINHPNCEENCGNYGCGN